MTCRSPTGNLWVLLEEGSMDDQHVARWSRWLNLETGEVRDMLRLASELIKYGWQVVP